MEVHRRGPAKTTARQTAQAAQATRTGALLKQPSTTTTTTTKSTTTTGPTTSRSGGAQQPALPSYSWKARSPNTKQVYITDRDQANGAIQALRGRYFGFDLEWKPIFHRGQRPNPVALVQIASDDMILLIQISAMPAIPKALIHFIGNPRQLKCGVNIQGDCKKLFGDFGIDSKNCVELPYLARSCDNARWKGPYKMPIGLARLTEIYEQRSLTKGPTRTSNWERSLTLQQQEYAANDAHVALTLYKRLRMMATAMANPPETVCYSFNCVGGRLCDTTGRSWLPYDPNYDPGPPPPPKEKKPKEALPSNGPLDPIPSSSSTSQSM